MLASLGVADGVVARSLPSRRGCLDHRCSRLVVQDELRVQAISRQLQAFILGGFQAFWLAPEMGAIDASTGYSYKRDRVCCLRSNTARSPLSNYPVWLERVPRTGEPSPVFIPHLGPTAGEFARTPSMTALKARQLEGTRSGRSRTRACSVVGCVGCHSGNRAVLPSTPPRVGDPLFPRRAISGRSGQGSSKGTGIVSLRTDPGRRHRGRIPPLHRRRHRAFAAGALVAAARLLAGRGAGWRPLTNFPEHCHDPAPTPARPE